MKTVTKAMTDLGMILFLFVMLVIPARANSQEKEKLVQQIDVRVKVYSDKNSFPPPPISLTLRMTVRHLVEKVESIYFSALDYQFLSLRSLRYAKYFLEKGNTHKANKYIEKADRYYRLATSLQRDSLAVLQSTISTAEWIVVYKASRTALDFTVAQGLGLKGFTLYDVGTLSADYLLDTSMMALEEAKKNLIAKAISRTLLRSIGASEFVGDNVKHGWGSSRAFPALQLIIGSSEFKDAVLKEYMRLGGDVGDYIARKAIEEVLERITSGDGTPPSSEDKPIIESKSPDNGIEKDNKGSPAEVGPEPQSEKPYPGDSAKDFVKPLDNGVIFDDNLSVAIAKIERFSDRTTVWLAFRRISEEWYASTIRFRLRIIDDRQNKYEADFYVPGKGAPPDLTDLPCGFTWVVPVKIGQIPEIAPISRIEMQRKGRVFLELNFSKPSFPNLEFEIKPEQLLSPGDELQISKDLSFRVGELTVEDEFPSEYGGERWFDLTLPLTIRNSDYNAHSMVRLVPGVLLEDGRVILPFRRGWEGPEVKALSTRTVDIGIRLTFTKDLEGIISIPHMLLLYKYSFPGHQFYRFFPILPELKHQCLEIKNSHLILESAKAKLDRWCNVNMSHLSGFRINDYAIVGLHIWAVGSRPVYTGPARVIHSSDGGNSWNVLWKHDETVLQQVHFLNEEKGLIATKTTILETSDGGRTWNVLLTVGHIPVLAIAQIEDFVVKGNQLTYVHLKGWMGEVIKTTDGGRTWYLVGHGGPKLRTQDGGKTWQKVEATESTPVEVPSPTPTKRKEPAKQIEKQVEDASSVFSTICRACVLAALLVSGK